MIDLAIITADVARHRVAQQFDVPAVTAPTAAAPVRRVAIRGLRAVADRLEPASRYATQS
jgi:hypothetical protein